MTDQGVTLKERIAQKAESIVEGDGRVVRAGKQDEFDKWDKWEQFDRVNWMKFDPDDGHQTGIEIGDKP